MACGVGRPGHVQPSWLIIEPVFERRRVPPIVDYRVVDGPAYLIAWRQGDDGSWWGLILWLTFDGETLRGAQAWAISDDLLRVPGQKYSNVPAWRRDRRRRWRPTDPTDPRDPGHMTRAEERALIEQRLRLDQPEEPDFLPHTSPIGEGDLIPRTRKVSGDPRWQPSSGI